MGYQQIRVSDELARSVQRAAGVLSREHRTLGGLVKAIAAERRVRCLGNLLSEEPTRHEVRVNGQVLYTFCFVDALMLPFVLPDGVVKVRSQSPGGTEVNAVVTSEGVQSSSPGVVVSFGAARADDGPTHATLCPYLNAFASRREYERWAAVTPRATTVALSLLEAFDLAKDWISNGTEDAEGDCCC